MAPVRPTRDVTDRRVVEVTEAGNLCAMAQRGDRVLSSVAASVAASECELEFS